MTEIDRVEWVDVMERAKFRAECAKRLTGPDLAWFIMDELKSRKDDAKPHASAVRLSTLSPRLLN